MKNQFFTLRICIILISILTLVACRKNSASLPSFQDPSIDTVLTDTTNTSTVSLDSPEIDSSEEAQIDTVGLALFVQGLNLSEDNPASFEINGKFAIMSGYINGTTPTIVQLLIDQNPELTTIIMMEMPGSDDDEANLIASRKIRDAGLCTFVPEGTFLASGAVDMFFAGVRRDICSSAEMGVHSWSDGNQDATDLPIDDAQHQFYIDYYIEMGLSVQMATDFYFFTINAAPANDIHWMTSSEIDSYGLKK